MIFINTFMRYYEILSEGVSYKKVSKFVNSFIDFAVDYLELDERPTIKIHTNVDAAKSDKSFGGYGGHNIEVYAGNRHPMDLLRTIAHELVHYRQDLRNQLHADSGKDGSEHENEANSVAAIILRRWGKLHPEAFGLESIIANGS